MGDLFLSLVEHTGPVGVVLGLVWLYLKQLHKELAEVQEKRVAEAQATINKLLELNDKWNETISAQIESAEGLKPLLMDLKTLLQNRRL